MQARTGAAGRRTLPGRKPLTREEDAKRWQRPEERPWCRPAPWFSGLQPGSGSAAPQPEVAKLPCSQTAAAPQPLLAALGSGPPSRQNRPRGGARRMGRGRGGAGWAPAWGCRTWEGSGPAVAAATVPPALSHTTSRRPATHPRRRATRPQPVASGSSMIVQCLLAVRASHRYTVRGLTLTVGGGLLLVSARLEQPFSQQHPYDALGTFPPHRPLGLPQGTPGAGTWGHLSFLCSLGRVSIPFVWDCLDCKQSDWSEARPKECRR